MENNNIIQLTEQISDLQNKINIILNLLQQQNEKIEIIVKVFKEFEEETNKFKDIDLLVSDEQIMQIYNNIKK